MYILKKECSTAHGNIVLTETEYKGLAEQLKQYYRKMTPEYMDKRNDQDLIDEMEELHGKQEVFDTH